MTEEETRLLNELCRAAKQAEGWEADYDDDDPGYSEIEREVDEEGDDDG